MSILFGIRKPSGAMVSREELLRQAAATSRYAPDGSYVFAHGAVGMGFQPYHTAERNALDTQPMVDSNGNILAFDGRLDNYQDLQVRLCLPREASDCCIVFSALNKWGSKCFAELIGDWSLSLWMARQRIIYLARDHAGTRTLYYTLRSGVLKWSTFLESHFVDDETFPLDERYTACYLTNTQLRDLTPYKGIVAVPPAYYTLIQENTIRTYRYWSPSKKHVVRYRADQDYEDHFIELYKQAVERRTGPGGPIIAQLSGGMDSTSIVCLSDMMRRARGIPPSGLLDTLSYYDPAEPSWDEEPYFTATERLRQKRGIHIRTSILDRRIDPSGNTQRRFSLPGMDVFSDSEVQYRDTEGRPYRVVLSGIGGDELLGGIPAPALELADLLVHGRLVRLLRQSLAWATAMRTPMMSLFRQTIVLWSRYYLHRPHSEQVAADWLTAKTIMLAEETTEGRTGNFGSHLARPSAIAAGRTWWQVMETLPHLNPDFLTRLEYRYPLLDRDLTDFIFAIPRDQLAIPGRRRYLMRRALRPYVPMEVIERRRKAFLGKTPLVALQAHCIALAPLFHNSVLADYHFLNLTQFRPAIDALCNGYPIAQWPLIYKALNLEFWVRGNLGCRLNKSLVNAAFAPLTFQDPNGAGTHPGPIREFAHGGAS